MANLIETTTITHATRAKYSRQSGVNEDSFFVPENSSAPVIPFLIAVADGVGSSGLPAHAARAAIRAARDFYENDATTDLAELVTNANRYVSEIPTNGLERLAPASTLVAAQITHEKVNVINVGDSRAYLYANKKLKQLTIDDTVAEQMIASGLLDAKERNFHPMSHALTRAIGLTSTKPEVGLVTSFSPVAGQLLILCTDGVYADISIDELEALLRSTPVEKVAERIVEAAADREIDDDITAVVAMFK